jgi:hypothetical protein
MIAIHQPNFFPWLGYFNKITQSDIFIFLDDAQIQKTGGSWSNRVKINISGKDHWLTAPIVRKFSGVKPLSEIEFNESIDWRMKNQKTIMMNYKKSPFYQECEELINSLIMNPESNLSRYNIHSIMEILNFLEIETDHIKISSKCDVNTTSTQRLIDLTKFFGGDTYMCGGGAEGYQEDHLFAAHGVKLSFQNFKHPEYSQDSLDLFLPGLSIIDALCNIGVEATKNLIIKK